MIIKETVTRDAKVCDCCVEPKDRFSMDMKLANCFVCNKDLCLEHSGGRYAKYAIDIKVLKARLKEIVG